MGVIFSINGVGCDPDAIIEQYIPTACYGIFAKRNDCRHDFK